MKISVRPRDMALSAELQKQVERSIAFAVDRYTSCVTHIAVYLADLNGPRGGVDKLCQITADVKGGLPVLILERGDDLLVTVNRAAKRLGYRIGRRAHRARTTRVRPRMEPRQPLEACARRPVISWPVANKKIA